MSRGDGPIIAALLGVGIVVSPLVPGRADEAASRAPEMMQQTRVGRPLAPWPALREAPELVVRAPAASPRAASRVSDARVEEALDARWVLGAVPDRPFDLIAGSDGLVRRDRAFGLDGRPLVVHVAASWCRPCADDFPAFMELAQVAPRAVYVANDDVAGPAGLTNAFEAVAARAEASSRAWPAGLELRADPGGAWLSRLGATSLPTTAVVDAHGHISMVIEGVLDEDLVLRVKAHLGILDFGGGAR